MDANHLAGIYKNIDTASGNISLLFSNITESIGNELVKSGIFQLSIPQTAILKDGRTLEMGNCPVMPDTSSYWKYPEYWVDHICFHRYYTDRRTAKSHEHSGKISYNTNPIPYEDVRVELLPKIAFSSYYTSDGYKEYFNFNLDESSVGVVQFVVPLYPINKVMEDNPYQKGYVAFAYPLIEERSESRKKRKFSFSEKKEYDVTVVESQKLFCLLGIPFDKLAEEKLSFSFSRELDGPFFEYNFVNPLAYIKKLTEKNELSSLHTLLEHLLEGYNALAVNSKAYANRHAKYLQTEQKSFETKISELELTESNPNLEQIILAKIGGTNSEKNSYSQFLKKYVLFNPALIETVSSPEGQISEIIIGDSPKLYTIITEDPENVDNALEYMSNIINTLKKCGFSGLAKTMRKMHENVVTCAYETLNMQYEMQKEIESRKRVDNFIVKHTIKTPEMSMEKIESAYNEDKLNLPVPPVSLRTKKKQEEKEEAIAN